MVSVSGSVKIPFLSKILPKWASLSVGFGVAIDPAGNIAVPVFGYAGGGKGASESLTANYTTSNAKNFSGFGGPFAEGGRYGRAGIGWWHGKVRWAGWRYWNKIFCWRGNWGLRLWWPKLNGHWPHDANRSLQAKMIIPLANMIRLLVYAEIMILFAVFGAQWVLYWLYMKHECTGRPLSVHQRQASLCVNQGEFETWNIISVMLTASFAVFWGTIAIIVIRHYFEKSFP